MYFNFHLIYPLWVQSHYFKKKTFQWAYLYINWISKLEKRATLKNSRYDEDPILLENRLLISIRD